MAQDRRRRPSQSLRPSRVPANASTCIGLALAMAWRWAGYWTRAVGMPRSWRRHVEPSAGGFAHGLASAPLRSDADIDVGTDHQIRRLIISRWGPVWETTKESHRGAGLLPWTLALSPKIPGNSRSRHVLGPEIPPFPPHKPTSRIFQNKYRRAKIQVVVGCGVLRRIVTRSGTSTPRRYHLVASASVWRARTAVNRG
jgi:hypothetical protein